jgi:hypothetical protein
MLHALLKLSKNRPKKILKRPKNDQIAKSFHFLRKNRFKKGQMATLTEAARTAKYVVRV